MTFQEISDRIDEIRLDTSTGAIENANTKEDKLYKKFVQYVATVRGSRDKSLAKKAKLILVTTRVATLDTWRRR